MRQRGFSLVELMVTIAIVAILVAIAFPSFEATFRSNRLATATNEMLASISLARSEAVRSTRGSGICASEDGSTCDGGWNDGWIVWLDEAGGTAAQFDEGVDTVVRHVESRSNLIVSAVNASDTAVTEIGFDPRGRPSIADLPLKWELKPDNCPAGGEWVRVIEVTLAGQVKSIKEDCPS